MQSRASIHPRYLAKPTSVFGAWPPRPATTTNAQILHINSSKLYWFNCMRPNAKVPCELLRKMSVWLHRSNCTFSIPCYGSEDKKLIEFCELPVALLVGTASNVSKNIRQGLLYSWNLLPEEFIAGFLILPKRMMTPSTLESQAIAFRASLSSRSACNSIIGFFTQRKRLAVAVRNKMHLAIPRHSLHLRHQRLWAQPKFLPWRTAGRPRSHGCSKCWIWEACMWQPCTSTGSMRSVRPKKNCRCQASKCQFCQMRRSFKLEGENKLSDIRHWGLDKSLFATLKAT